MRRLAPHIDAEAEALMLEKREADDQEGVSVMSGAADLLSSYSRRTLVRRHLRYSLPGYSATEARQSAHSECAGVSRRRFKRASPIPEPYLTGARLLGVNPTECLVIEDAPAGIRAAHAGGMKAIGITSTYPASGLQEADAVIQKLSQIKVESVGGKLRVNVS